MFVNRSGFWRGRSWPSARRCWRISIDCAVLRRTVFHFLAISAAALAMHLLQISQRPQWSLMKMRLDVSGLSQNTHWRGGLRKGNRHDK